MKKWVKIDKSAPSARADFIRVWVEDLFYGDKVQTQDFLCKIDHNMNFSFCCLGVATVQNGYKPLKVPKEIKDYVIPAFGNATINKKIGNQTSVPKPLARFLGMDYTGMFQVSARGIIKSYIETIYNENTQSFCSLADMNDKEIPFWLIAKVIVQYPEHIFYNPRLTEAELAYIKATKLER